jgi:ribonuclease J
MKEKTQSFEEKPFQQKQMEQKSPTPSYPSPNREKNHFYTHSYHSHASKKSPQGKQTLKAYVIGGLNEVGKNCLALECNNDIIVIDVGMAFPDDEMLGVDFVIPDTTFLEKNKHRVRGIIITHGHLDHIGGLQHILPKLDFPPMIMTKLTSGLVKKRIEEYNIAKHCTIHIIDPIKDVFRLGCFQLEFFPVNHSIPDCMGVYGKTPAGSFVHTGDFKFDFTPVGCPPADLGRMAEIGRKEIDIIFCESTNAPKSGYCTSEKVIVENLETIISEAKGRIILASFSSLISRIEQIIHFATKYNRKVFISGRSMQNTLEIAAKLGYFKIPKGSIRRLGPSAEELPPKQVLILTTGSQGEPRSALTRIGHGTHSQISIQKGDTVVFSSSPIPGNERGVYSTVNNLIKLGAKVITNDTMDIHASGHGHSGDIRMMHALMKAKYIVPIHGELFMRQAHKKIAIELGYDPEKVYLLENGSIIEHSNGSIRKSKSKIPSEIIMIDGLGSGDIGTKVMEERKKMANGGSIVVVLKVMKKSRRLSGDPEIFSKGFIYMRESKEILQQAKIQVRKSYEQILKGNPDVATKDLKRTVIRSLQTLIYKRIQREPMIFPIIITL